MDQGESFAIEAYLPLVEDNTSSEPSAETPCLSSMDQGEPPATQLLVLGDSASSEPSAEALFPSSMDQGEPFAIEAYLPLVEDIEPSQSFATEVYFPLLEDIEASESPLMAEAYFPLLEDSASSEPSGESVFMLEKELFDLMNVFFNTISSWEVFKILCNL